MKVKKNYVLKEIADEYVVIPVGKEAVKFNGLISLNKSGKRLFVKLQEETNEAALVDYLLSVYDVDEEKAKLDVSNFLAVLRGKELLEE